jgi:protein-tyrosine phosphatase
MESLLMFHPFDILTLDNGARLIFTPAREPEGATCYSLKSLKEAGAQAVITMMTLAELSENEADALPSLCADFYMDWFHLPVEDSCAPEAPFEQAFAREKTNLLAIVRSGGTMVIHCHGGSGRTGMMAAILMLESGYLPAQVKKQVQLIRPKSLTSPVQVSYLNRRYGYQ